MEGKQDKHLRMLIEIGSGGSAGDRLVALEAEKELAKLMGEDGESIRSLASDPEAMRQMGFGSLKPAAPDEEKEKFRETLEKCARVLGLEEHELLRCAPVLLARMEEADVTHAKHVIMKMKIREALS